MGPRLTFLDKLNLFVGTYAQMFLGIFRFSWWSPFFIYAIFQLAGFFALLWYYAPVLSVIIYPILSVFLPSNIFHYPQYYLALPSVFATYDSLILGVTLWIIFTATAVYRLGGVYDGKVPTLGDGVRKALYSYFPLFMVWLIETIAVIVILYVPNLLLKERMAGSPNFSAAVSVLFELIGLIVAGMLIYSVPGIILDGRRTGDAIKTSIGLFVSNFFLTYFIVLIPNLIRIIINLLLSNYAPKIISLFNPELIPALLIIYIIVGIFVNLFIYGPAVFVYKRMAE